MLALRRRGAVLSFFSYFLLISCLIIALFPFWWMVVASFQSEGEIFAYPPKLWPNFRYLRNYVRAFTETSFLKYFFNSVFIATAYTLLALAVCSLGGFGFAKYRFKFQNVLFAVVVGSLMIPFYVLLVPMFLIMNQLRLTDTYFALIVPFAANAFGVFLMRQYMISIPSELMDAARIDGCSEFGIYVRVALPLVRPGLGVLTILLFMQSWNDFVWPLIMLRSNERYTLQLALASLQSTTSIDWEMIMAGSVLTTFPVIMVFMFMQQQFIAGLTAGALKG